MSVRSDFIAAVKFFDTLSEHWDQLKMVGSETSEQPSKSYRAQELAEVFAGNYNLVPKSELEDSSNVLSQNIVDRELFETLPKQRQRQVNHFLKTQRQNLIKKTIAATQLVVDVLENSSEKDFNLAFRNLNRGYYSKSSQQISALFKNIKAYQGNFNVNNFMACADLVIHGYLPLLRNYKNSSNYDNQLVSNMSIDQRMALVAVAPYLKQSTKKRTVVIQGGVQEKIVPQIIEKTKYVEVVKYMEPGEEMNINVDLMPTMMGGTLNSNTYVNELHKMQSEFNSNFMNLYRKLIEKLETLDMEKLKSNTTIDMVNVVRLLETIMVSSGKTLTYITGLVQGKNINITYINDCKRFKQLIQSFDVFKEIVPIISGMIELCQNVHKKHTEMSTKYINTPKTSTEIYNGERKFADEMPTITFDKSFVVRKNDIINNLYNVISSVKNLSFENTLTKNVLKNYIGDKDIRKKAINNYFDNYVNSVKFSISSVPINRELTYIKPFVDMKLALIAQARQSYHWLNERLDTFLVQQRIEQLGNEILDNKTLQNIADAYINFNKYYKVTWKSIAEKYYKFGDSESVTSFFKLFKLAKQTFEEVDAFMFLEKMYRALGIDIDNFPEFKSKLIDYLCINMIWFDVYVEDDDGKFRIADIASIKEIDDEIHDEFEEKYNLPNCAYQKLNEVLNLNELSTSIKINNHYTRYGSLLKNIVEHGNTPENGMLIGYSMRFPSAVIADFEDFNTYVIESLYTPLLQIVDKYIAQRYNGNYDLNMNINMMMQGGDEKEQGGSIYDIVPNHIPKTETVRKDCVKLYLSVYTIMNFYINTYVANPIEGIRFKISKFSPFYAFKDEFEGHIFNIESEKTLDTYLELCHKFYDSVFGKTIDERNDKAVELVIHELNSMLLFANDELMLRSRVDSSGSDTMLEVRFKEIRKTMQDSLTIVGTNMFKNGKFTNSYIDKFFETSTAKIESVPDHMKKSTLMKIIREIDSDSDVNKISDETKSYLDLCVAPMYIISNAYMSIIEDIVRHIDGFNELEDHHIQSGQRVQTGKARLLALVMMNNVSLETTQKEFFFSIIETYYKQCDEIFHNLMNFPGLSDESIQTFYNEYHETFKNAIDDLKEQISDNLRNRDTLKIVDITSGFRSLFKDRVNIPTILDRGMIAEFNGLISKYEYAKEPIGYQVFDPKWNSTFTEFVLTVLGYVGQNLAAPVEFVEELINSRLNGNTFEEIISTTKQVAKNDDIAFLKESLERYNLSSILVAIGMNGRNRDRTTISSMSQTLINKYLAIIPFLVYILEKCKTLFVGNHTYYTYLNRNPTRPRGGHGNVYNAINNMRGENPKAINAKTEIQILIDLLNTYYINLGTYADEHQFGTSIESTKTFEHSLSELRLLVSNQTFNLLSFIKNVERYEWILPRCIPKEYIKSAKYDRFKTLIDKHYIVTANPTFKQSLHNTLDVIARTLMSLLMVKLSYVTITVDRPDGDFANYHDRDFDDINNIHLDRNARMFGGKNENSEDRVELIFGYICNLFGIPTLDISGNSDLYELVKSAIPEDENWTVNFNVLKHILNWIFTGLNGIKLLEQIVEISPSIISVMGNNLVQNENNNIILSNLQVSNDEMKNYWISENMKILSNYNNIISKIQPDTALNIFNAVINIGAMDDAGAGNDADVAKQNITDVFGKDKAFEFINDISENIRDELLKLIVDRAITYIRFEHNKFGLALNITNSTEVDKSLTRTSLCDHCRDKLYAIVNADNVPSDSLKQYLIGATYCILEPVLIENKSIKSKDYIVINGAQLDSFNSDKQAYKNYCKEHKQFTSTLMPRNISMMFRYSNHSKLGDVVEAYMESDDFKHFVSSTDKNVIQQELKYIYSQLQTRSITNMTYDKSGFTNFLEKLSYSDIIYIYIILYTSMKQKAGEKFDSSEFAKLISSMKSILNNYEKISEIHNTISNNSSTILLKNLKGGNIDTTEVLLFELLIKMLEQYELENDYSTFVFNINKAPELNDINKTTLPDDDIVGFFKRLTFTDINHMIDNSFNESNKLPLSNEYNLGTTEENFNLFANDGFMHVKSMNVVRLNDQYNNGKNNVVISDAGKKISENMFTANTIRLKQGIDGYGDHIAIEYYPRVSTIRLKFKEDNPFLYCVKDTIKVNGVEISKDDFLAIYELGIQFNTNNIAETKLDQMNVIITKATHIPRTTINTDDRIEITNKISPIDNSVGEFIKLASDAYDQLFIKQSMKNGNSDLLVNQPVKTDLFDIFDTFAGYITDLIRGNTVDGDETDKKIFFGTKMTKYITNVDLTLRDAAIDSFIFSGVGDAVLKPERDGYIHKYVMKTIYNITTAPALDGKYINYTADGCHPENANKLKELFGLAPEKANPGNNLEHIGIPILDVISRSLFTGTVAGLAKRYVDNAEVDTFNKILTNVTYDADYNRDAHIGDTAAHKSKFGAVSNTGRQIIIHTAKIALLKWFMVKIYNEIIDHVSTANKEEIKDYLDTIFFAEGFNVTNPNRYDFTKYNAVGSEIDENGKANMENRSPAIRYVKVYDGDGENSIIHQYGQTKLSMSADDQNTVFAICDNDSDDRQIIHKNLHRNACWEGLFAKNLIGNSKKIAFAPYQSGFTGNPRFECSSTADIAKVGGTIKKTYQRVLALDRSMKDDDDAAVYRKDIIPRKFADLFVTDAEYYLEDTYGIYAKKNGFESVVKAGRQHDPFVVGDLMINNPYINGLKIILNKYIPVLCNERSMFNDNNDYIGNATISVENKLNYNKQFENDMKTYIQGIINGFLKRKLFGETLSGNINNRVRTRTNLNELIADNTESTRICAEMFGQVALKSNDNMNIAMSLSLPRPIFKIDETTKLEVGEFKDTITAADKTKYIFMIDDGDGYTDDEAAKEKYLTCSEDEDNYPGVYPRSDEVYDNVSLVEKIWNRYHYLKNLGFTTYNITSDITDYTKNIIFEQVLRNAYSNPGLNRKIKFNSGRELISINPMSEYKLAKNEHLYTQMTALTYDIVNNLFVKDLISTAALFGDASIIRPNIALNIDTINIDFNNISFKILKSIGTDGETYAPIYDNSYNSVKQLTKEVSSVEILQQFFNTYYRTNYYDELHNFLKSNAGNEYTIDFGSYIDHATNHIYRWSGTGANALKITAKTPEELPRDKIDLLNFNYKCLSKTNINDIQNGHFNWHIDNMGLNMMLRDSNINGNYNIEEHATKMQAKPELYAYNHDNVKIETLKDSDKKLESYNDIYKQMFNELNKNIERLNEIVGLSTIRQAKTYNREDLKYMFKIIETVSNTPIINNIKFRVTSKLLNDPFNNLYTLSKNIRNFNTLMNKGYYNDVYEAFTKAIESTFNTYKTANIKSIAEIEEAFKKSFESELDTKLTNTLAKKEYLIKYVVGCGSKLEFNDLKSFYNSIELDDINTLAKRLDFANLKNTANTGYGTGANIISRIPGIDKMFYIQNKNASVVKEQDTPMFRFIYSNSGFSEDNFKKYIIELRRLVNSLGTNVDQGSLRTEIADLVNYLNLNGTGIGQIIKKSAENAWFPRANGNRGSQENGDTNGSYSMAINQEWKAEQITQFIKSLIHSDHVSCKNKMTIPGSDNATAGNSAKVQSWKENFVLFKDILTQPTPRPAALATAKGAAVTTADMTYVPNFKDIDGANLVKKYNSIIMYCCLSSISKNNMSFEEYWKTVLQLLSKWPENKWTLNEHAQRKHIYSYFDYIHENQLNAPLLLIDDLHKYNTNIKDSLYKPINDNCKKLYDIIETIKASLSEFDSAKTIEQNKLYHICKTLALFKELRANYNNLISSINDALSSFEIGSAESIAIIKFVKNVNAYFSFDQNVMTRDLNAVTQKDYLLPIDTVQSFPQAKSYSWLDTIEKIENNKGADFYHARVGDRLKLISRVSKEYETYSKKYGGHSVLDRIINTLEYFIYGSKINLDIKVESGLYNVKPFTKSLYRFISNDSKILQSNKVEKEVSMKPNEVFNIFMRSVMDTPTMQKLNFLNKSPKPRIFRSGLVMHGGDLDESDTTSLTNEAYYNDVDHNEIEPLVGLIDDEHKSRKEGIIAYYNKALLSFNSFFTKNIFSEIIYNSALFDAGIRKIHEELLNHIGDNIDEKMMTYWTRMIDMHIGKQPSYDFSTMANIKRAIEYEDEGVYGENYGEGAIQPSMNNNFYLKSIATHDDIIKKVYEIINESQGTNMIKTLLKIDACNTIVGVLLQFLKTFSFRNVDYNANEPYSSNTTSIEPFDIDRF